MLLPQLASAFVLPADQPQLGHLTSDLTLRVLSRMCGRELETGRAKASALESPNLRPVLYI